MKEEVESEEHILRSDKKRQTDGQRPSVATWVREDVNKREKPPTHELLNF